MSAYREPIEVSRVCAVCGAIDRKLHTPREVAAPLCMPCVLAPDSLAVLEAVKDGRVTPAGAEVLIDHRSWRRRSWTNVARRAWFAVTRAFTHE